LISIFKALKITSVDPFNMFSFLDFAQLLAMRILGKWSDQAND
jgi:hypothetical protein